MVLPSLEQYNEALQNPRTSFFDADLQNGKVRENSLGVPVAACGGFALTYNISCNSGKYAVRCFHKEARNLTARYDAITKKLAYLNSDYFVNFQFQNQGIRVRGAPYPIVKMSWANGVTIGEFLEQNYRDSARIAKLKQAVITLAAYLQKNGIAHGDIQPGNLMVDNTGSRIQLIDYDGMYLPEISSLGSEEAGHRNFQHPQRISLNPWNDRLDRFSFIMLVVALSALEHNSALWRSTQSDGDSFLFKANDFASPDTSATFSAAYQISAIKDKVAGFASLCKTSLDSIPSLEDFLNSTITVQFTPVAGKSTQKYISTYPVLNAHNYDACLNYVGNMVELIGKVKEVKCDKTRYGREYYFLNFSDWRGNAVRITIWPRHLNKYSHIDFNSLKDKYISVIGLLLPPYVKTTKRYSYSHISIELDNTTSFNEIEKNEAKYRLGYEKNPVANVSALNTIRNTQSFGTKTTQPVQTTQKTRSNSDILKIIKGTSTPSNKEIKCSNCGFKINVGNSGTVQTSCPLCSTNVEYNHLTGNIKNLSAQISANQNILSQIKNKSSSRQSQTPQSQNHQISNQSSKKKDNPVLSIIKRTILFLVSS